MTEFSEGDLIEATKGDRRVIDRVQLHADFERLWIDGVGFLNNMSADNILAGHTLTLIEKAAPALPTEEGWYTDKHDDLWRCTGAGYWFMPGGGNYDGREAEFAPFTRLEPVADTAKKVIDQIRARESIIAGSHVVEMHNIRAVAAEFGVTS